MAEDPVTTVEAPPKRLPSGAARLRKRRNRGDRLALKSTILILAIVVIFGVGVMWSGGGVDFLRSLYNPVAVIVVIFAMIEYIVLKGRDRSRIYRMELEQMRERRRQDVESLRALSERLDELSATMRSLSQDAEKAGDLVAWQQALREASARISQANETLKRRL